MAAKTLTAAAVRTLRPTSQRQEIKDAACPGLYLVIQTSGARSWALRFRRPDGRPAKMTLGVADLSGREMEGQPVIGQPLTLSAARQLAAQVMRDRAMGLDVIGNRKVAKQRARVEQVTRAQNNFVECARAFVDGHAKPKTRDWQRTAKLIGLTPEGEVISRGLCDRWGDRPITEISSHDVYDATDEARRIGVPGWASNGQPSESRARHLHAALSTLFGWCIRHRRVESNVVDSVHRPDTAQSRERTLNNAEIVKFWQAASAESLGPLLKLLLLTGCRLREVSGMKRSEVSDGVWSIPGSRTKNGKTHEVPLPPLALSLIASVPNIGTDLIWTTTGTTPVSGWSKLKGRLEVHMGNDVPPCPACTIFVGPLQLGSETSEFSPTSLGRF